MADSKKETRKGSTLVRSREDVHPGALNTTTVVQVKNEGKLLCEIVISPVVLKKGGTMILRIVEYLRNERESLEIYEGKCNNAYVHKLNGVCIIYQSAIDFVRAACFGEHVPRKHCRENQLDDLVRHARDYNDIKLTEDRT